MSMPTTPQGGSQAPSPMQIDSSSPEDHEATPMEISPSEATNPSINGPSSPTVSQLSTPHLEPRIILPRSLRLEPPVPSFPTDPECNCPEDCTSILCPKYIKQIFAREASLLKEEQELWRRGGITRNRCDDPSTHLLSEYMKMLEEAGCFYLERPRATPPPMSANTNVRIRVENSKFLVISFLAEHPSLTWALTCPPGYLNPFPPLIRSPTSHPVTQPARPLY
ncbi:hypothetical protein K470DRAFT_288767 [Piedraia hortae CBS 480.64]|uniref:Uncharacterized protein n=1 Tax=Piedraia hortae CBS 480.64 TaxID=1314780 RepID=A0A6A7BW33_9PEZI|nr:hypothetical protein K470DRAFT_288767 [Piedraia hortae CBS 480.64]